MRKSWLVCALMGTMAWAQAPPGTPPPAQMNQAPAPGAAKPAPPPDMSASVPDDAAVITITGVCPPAKTMAAKAGATATAKPAASAPKNPADCKTVITKAEFEKLAKGVAPNMTPQLKRQLASVLPRLIVMSQAAEKKGLDKTPQFAETLKFAKMQILTNELQRKIQEEAANVTPEDIDNYYKTHPETYEQYDIDRLFVPRFKQAAPEAEDKDDKDKDAKLTDEQQKAKETQEKSSQEQGEKELATLADTLHARAAAGEDISKLQKEAFDAAGMKVDSPTTNLAKVRRTGLPPDHTKAGVFDLKPGDVSQVITDNGGHYIYKMKSKEQLPLDKVKDEIHSALQSQRQREMMDKVQGSFKSEPNETYFGPAGPAGMHPMPPPRMPNPHMVPGPTAPSAQPSAPPPASNPN